MHYIPSACFLSVCLSVPCQLENGTCTTFTLWREVLHMSGIIGRCVCVSVVVQRAGEEACCIAAAAPGTETPETDGGAAAEERCCSEGARDAAGQMYWLTGLELTFDRQFVLSPSSRQFDLWLHTWHQWQATPAGSSDACIQRQLTVKNDAEVVSCEICFKLHRL